jgi:hypothetical protein
MWSRKRKTKLVRDGSFFQKNYNSELETLEENQNEQREKGEIYLSIWDGRRSLKNAVDPRL